MRSDGLLRSVIDRRAPLGRPVEPGAKVQGKLAA